MHQLMRLIGDWHRASRASRRSAISMLSEAFLLRFSAGRLGLSEYLDFRLYQEDLRLSEKRAFAGWRAQAVIEEILVDDYARFLSLDKITMYALLSAYGLAIPNLRALYRSRRPTKIPCLDTPDALAAFLQAPDSLPLYLKPSLGSYGRGNTLIRHLRAENLVFGDGTETPILQFCESLDSGHGLGWILQEPLTPHPRIAAICGDKISGIRVHTFLSAQGPTVTKAIWKINVGKEDSDNFRHGMSGNLLAALDLQSGLVTRVVSGTGFDQQVNPCHPVSGQELLNFVIPDWEKIRSLVCEAQLAFPGFISPGWDIAVCEDGPKILEVNFFGDVDLSQHAYRRGFLDENLIRLMRGRGLDGLLSKASMQWKRSRKNNRLGRRRHHWDW